MPLPVSACEANMVPVDNQASLSSLMKHKMESRPKSLSPSAGRKECCIFRAPPDLLEINKEAYYPHVVSIGPYHHGEEHLQMLEEHKWRLLSSLLARCEPHGIHLQDLIDAVSPEEERIRESYSECISKFDREELVMMMVLDGIFIIEYLATFRGKVVKAKPDDPIFKVIWIVHAVLLDLLQLENQIPYFVLEKLFEVTRASREGNSTLAGLALKFFNAITLRPDHVIDYYVKRINDQAAPKHLLDLHRASFMPPEENYTIHDRNCPPSQMIPSTQMLRQAGIKFREKKSAYSFLEVSFTKGTLEIPCFRIGHYNHRLLLNFIAFEQWYYWGDYPCQHMTSYAVLMGCLINSTADYEYLQCKRIIESYVGTHEEVARIFNQIFKNVILEVYNHYLYTVFEGINKYSSDKWRVGWGGIKQKYFGAPWAWIAALGALLGLLLTATQTLFSVLSYVNNSPN